MLSIKFLASVAAGAFAPADSVAAPQVQLATALTRGFDNGVHAATKVFFTFES